MKERPLRADAERNRLQILEVAQQVFATEGIEVPIDEIARRAGLGVGTLYRHFPTKEALFAAIVLERMQEVVNDARSGLDAGDAGEAFFGFMTRLIQGWGKKKDLIAACTSAGVDLKELGALKKELHEQMAKLLERAQASGAVREGVTIPEIMALISGAFGSLDRHDITADGRERMLSVVLDGLRTRR